MSRREALMIRKVKPMCMCMCMCMGGKASTCVQLKTQTQFALRGEKGEIHGRVVKVLLLLLVALAED